MYSDTDRVFVESLPLASKFPKLILGVQLWRIDGQPGLYRYVCDTRKEGISDTPVRMDETLVKAKYNWGYRAHKLVRLLDLEQDLARMMGHELVTDLDLMVCDSCGIGMLTSVDLGEVTYCRPCASAVS